MTYGKYIRNAIFVTGLVSMAAIFSRCSAGSSAGGGTAPLSTAGKITTGLGSATTTMQGLGGALANGNSTFSTGGNTITSAATSCTSHGDPATDGNNGQPVDGVITENEKFNPSGAGSEPFALQKFYCTLAADTSGPESVSGTVRQIKMVACAVEKNLGSLTFDGVARPLSAITIDTTCATALELQGMNNGVPTTSFTISLALTVTAALNPTFPEISGNTYYSHGIRMASNDGTSLKYIILAKFDDTIAGDPTEQNDFEFATLGTGTVMQGAAYEFTAAKIHRTSATAGTLWYESRINRIKASASDPLCNPSDPASQSCGFARHTRIRTDLTFASGDISDVSNMSGVISEGSDTTGSAQFADSANVLTATGSLAGAGISGKIWTSSISPADFTTQVLTDVSAFPTMGITTTCISGGGSISTSCGLAPAPLAPVQAVLAFVAPANDAVWINYLSTHGGLGYSSSTSMTDIQSAL